MRKLLPDSIGIFILPPSVQELGNRLRGRKTESEDAIQKRLNTAKREIQQAAQYDYVVVNDTVEKAAAQVAEIISSEKYKTSRNSALIERVLNND